MSILNADIQENNVSKNKKLTKRYLL